MGQKDDEDALPKWRADLRRSGNPYATHYYEPQGSAEPPNSARRKLRATENPYAYDYFFGAANTLSVGVISSENPKQNPTPRKKLSKAEFDSGCRSVFKRYMPEMERKKLREHHQDFIRRNVGCSPERRYALLQELRRYDLSTELGLQTYFNREEDIFTETKLINIERSVKED